MIVEGTKNSINEIGAAHSVIRRHDGHKFALGLAYTDRNPGLCLAKRIRDDTSAGRFRHTTCGISRSTVGNHNLVNVP
jgi:hypothetical protein